MLLAPVASLHLWCALMGRMTERAELDKRAGLPYEFAYLKNQLNIDPATRSAGVDILWFVYNANTDNRMSPTFMRFEVQRVCEGDEHGRLR